MSKAGSMSVEEIESKIKTVIAEELGVDVSKVVPEASFTEDLGADSLDNVELVMMLEEQFGIEIPDEEAQKILTVGDVITFIKNSANV